MPAKLVEDAPAKVNLTLRVLGRRADGYHEIARLVVFARCGDRLSFTPRGKLDLDVHGPGAAQAGAVGDNLVLKAARALAIRIPEIALGAFVLDKQLPVAAGLGGGSADAAAALRLIARANDLALDDKQLYEAAHATGADVPVCLDPRPRVMRGIGEKLSEPLHLPPLHAVLVNPGVAVATKDVFAKWSSAAKPAASGDFPVSAKSQTYDALLALLRAQPNDLEVPAIILAPIIAEVLAALRALPGCDLARMSGSGATCFGLFSSHAETVAAGDMLRARFPHWWISETALG